MISFEQYSKICNNYGICYFGYADEYLLLLKLVRPILESNFPNLNIFIGSRDEASHYLADAKNTLKVSELKIKRPYFAHIRELQFDGYTHPIEDLLNEGNIRFTPLHFENQENISNICSIITSSCFPTKDLNQDQIDAAKLYARSQGFDPQLNADVCKSGMVIGVESVPLVEALILGKRTLLIPTGVGENIFKKIFANIEILGHLSHR